MLWLRFTIARRRTLTRRTRHTLQRGFEFLEGQRSAFVGIGLGEGSFERTTLTTRRTFTVAMRWVLTISGWTRWMFAVARWMRRALAIAGWTRRTFPIAMRWALALSVWARRTFAVTRWTRRMFALLTLSPALRQFGHAMDEFRTRQHLVVVGIKMFE